MSHNYHLVRATMQKFSTSSKTKLVVFDILCIITIFICLPNFKRYSRVFTELMAKKTLSADTPADGSEKDLWALFLVDFHDLTSSYFACSWLLIQNMYKGIPVLFQGSFESTKCLVWWGFDVKFSITDYLF